MSRFFRDSLAIVFAPGLMRNPSQDPIEVLQNTKFESRFIALLFTVSSIIAALCLDWLLNWRCLRAARSWISHPADCGIAKLLMKRLCMQCTHCVDQIAPLRTLANSA